jgi:hypothetical protein
MLCVRIEGHEVETTPASLAELVFDGKVDRHSPARLPAGVMERIPNATGRAWGPAQSLEQSLRAPYCEALTSELHRRLRRMCTLDVSAVDVQELCARVEDLCQWRWPNPPLVARFFWTAGWLNELVDRPKSALDFYETFLLMPARESHLRLLALNNRGVLRIHLGRLDGVEDLARAAVGDFGLRTADCGLKETHEANPPSAIRNPQGDGLPAACFNLLNLINVSFGAADLLRAVDEELMDFFSRLPAEGRVLWLGPRDSCGPILRDPTYQGLNRLVTRLAAQARMLVAYRDATPPVGETGPVRTRSQSHYPSDRASSLFCRLSLWDCHGEGDSAGAPDVSRGAYPFVEGGHQRYAEAASLLPSDDVPSLLTRPEGPLVRVEQAAQEEMALIEGHLASGQYELARSRLQVQRRILSCWPASRPNSSA